MPEFTKEDKGAILAIVVFCSVMFFYVGRNRIHPELPLGGMSVEDKSADEKVSTSAKKDLFLETIGLDKSQGDGGKPLALGNIGENDGQNNQIDKNELKKQQPQEEQKKVIKSAKKEEEKKPVKTPKKIVQEKVQNPEWFTYLQENEFTREKSIKEYRGTDLLSRGEGGIIFSRFAELYNLDKTASAEDCEFTDISEYDLPTKASFVRSCLYGLFRGRNGAYLPKESMKKSEVLALLVRSFDGYLDEGYDYWYQKYFEKGMALEILNADTKIGELETTITRKNLGERLYRLEKSGVMKKIVEQAKKN